MDKVADGRVTSLQEPVKNQFACMYVCTPVCFMRMKVTHGHMVRVHTLLCACSVCLLRIVCVGPFCVYLTHKCVVYVHAVCVSVNMLTSLGHIRTQSQAILD